MQNNKNSWQSLLEKLITIPEEHSVASLVMRTLETTTFPASLIDIDLDHKSVSIAGHRVELSGKKLIVHLFQILNKNQPSGVTRDHLIQELYLNGRQPNGISERQRRCYNHNLIKLLSRARSLAKQALPRSRKIPVKWFPYDAETQRWRLFALTNDGVGKTTQSNSTSP